MVSYIRPVEENSTSPLSPRNLSLNLNLTTNKMSSSSSSPPLECNSSIGGDSHNTVTVNNGSGLRKLIMDDDISTILCDENTKLLQSETAIAATTTTTSIIKKMDNPAFAFNPNNNNVHQNVDPCSENGGNEEGDTDTGGDGAKLSNQLKKGKLIHKDGTGATKTVPSKRVSFGSSKGSMVETLVFETPTPLPEHAEREFGFPPENLQNITNATGGSINTNTSTCSIVIGSSGGGIQSFHNNNNNNNNNLNSAINKAAAAAAATLSTSSCTEDSGIELPEELERSKVRVSFYHSSQPQQVSPPESYCYYKDPFNLDTFSSDTSVTDDINNINMTAATATQINYDRQQSTESGWENPFRPGGDLSREADEIVNMIKGGKPITPTGEVNHSITNGNAQTGNSHYPNENGNAVVDGATKLNVSQSQSAQNGTKSPQNRPAAAVATTTTATNKNGATSTQVSNVVVPGPTSASHVVIDEKKKKKCACCVIQ